MKNLFEGFDRSRYEDEARHRWGKSEAFVESQKRTRRYMADDWKALKAEEACSHTMHTGLASMYESDDRFRQSIDRHGPGLTSFLAEAIRANAARHQD